MEYCPHCGAAASHRARHEQAVTSPSSEPDSSTGNSSNSLRIFVWSTVAIVVIWGTWLAVSVTRETDAYVETRSHSSSSHSQASTYSPASTPAQYSAICRWKGLSDSALNSSGVRFLPPKSGNMYIATRVRITNTGPQEIRVVPGDFTLYVDGVGTSPKPRSLANNPLQHVTLKPGAKTSGDMVFEVSHQRASNVTNVELKWRQPGADMRWVG